MSQINLQASNNLQAKQTAALLCCIQDSIHRIKVAFNKDFDAMLALKGKNILSIKEKNQRIRKIMKDINLSEVVVDPDLSTYEKPEMLFFTSDEEVT